MSIVDCDFGRHKWKPIGIVRGEASDKTIRVTSSIYCSDCGRIRESTVTV